MELFSLAFLLFLGVTATAYHLVGTFLKRGSWVVLLAASLAFYCIVGSWKTLVYLLVCAVATWLAPLVFARFDARAASLRKAAADRAEKRAIKARAARKKRAVLAVTLLVCFGILAAVKYLDVILAELGSPMRLGLLLPLGISFYTFQSVAYLIDAYNGKFDPQRNFLKHLLFVSYFPQIIQGPINRYESLGPQLLEYHPLSTIRLDRAALRFLYGAFKKLVMANLLVTTIQTIFSNVSPDIPGSVAAFGILLYSAQQYGDFSGGIDMVQGASEFLGIEMAPNFRRPYFATSLSDFWRRWHIALGAWMRDYVFYPFALTKLMKRFGGWSSEHLGRHVGRTLPACVANILVFFIVGLWHGAEAHYLAWGIYNGLVIAGADLLAPVFQRMNDALHVNRGSVGHHVFAVVRTFIVVNIGWYFDRIYNFGDSLLCLRNTFTNFQPSSLLPWLGTLGLAPQTRCLVVASIACVVVFVVSFAQERGVDVRERFLGWNAVARGVVYFAALSLIAFSTVATQGVAGGFMYANF